MALGTKKISEMPYLRVKSYTQAEADTYGAGTAGAGAIIRISDGDNGRPCLAMSDGVSWQLMKAVPEVSPSFFVKKTAVQSGVPDATFTEITWDDEVYDNGNYFDSNGWTPPAGLVTLSSGFLVGGTMPVGNLVAIVIKKNGVTISQANWRSGSNAGSAFLTVASDCDGTQKFTVELYVDLSSGTGTVQAGANSFFFGSMIN